MKLYTRSGDDGTTGLFGGERVGKDHPRVEAYGAVDEFNAGLGQVATLLETDSRSKSASGEPAEYRQVCTRLREILARLQSRLFDLGADLATPGNSRHESKVRRINADDVAEAERWIDEIDGGNNPIRTFILPGGSELAARLHVARGVCRRAERAMVALNRQDPISSEAIKYVNRISDLLFAMARRANKAAGIPDVKWHE